MKRRIWNHLCCLLLMLSLLPLGSVTASASRTQKEFVFAMSHCPEPNLAAVTSDSLPCAATYTAVLAADPEDLRDLMLCPGGMPFGVKSLERRQNDLVARLFSPEERMGVNVCRLVTRAFELRIIDIDNLEPDEE